MYNAFGVGVFKPLLFAIAICVHPCASVANYDIPSFSRTRPTPATMFASFARAAQRAV